MWNFIGNIFGALLFGLGLWAYIEAMTTYFNEGNGFMFVVGGIIFPPIATIHGIGMLLGVA